MALLKKRDFAKLSNVTTSDLGKYIKRGKVTALNDLIDDQDPKNIWFLERRLAKQKLAAETLAPEEEPGKSIITTIFEEELEDEYLWGYDMPYSIEKEKVMFEMSKDWPAGNRPVPRFYLDQMANGAMIELAGIFLQREIDLRKETGLPLEGIKKDYLAICQLKIAALATGITEIMEDFEDDSSE